MFSTSLGINSSLGWVFVDPGMFGCPAACCSFHAIPFGDEVSGLALILHTSIFYMHGKKQGYLFYSFFTLSSLTQNTVNPVIYVVILFMRVVVRAHK